MYAFVILTNGSSPSKLALMIKFDQVSKDFCHGQKVALEDVSFEIDDGEFVFVTGHSGSGKTTLLRLLMRELQPTHGTVYFDNKNLRRLSRGRVAKHRRKVGVVFQDYRLIEELSVAENIALPLVIAKARRREIDKRVTELLELLGLEGYENVFPSQLSGGEAQRVGLARALITAPEVIFADEPTGNLDAENALELLKLLASVNEYGTTVIMTTHDLSLLSQIANARHMDFRRGRLVQDTGSAIKNMLVGSNPANTKQPTEKVEKTAPTPEEITVEALSEDHAPQPAKKSQKDEHE